MVRFALRLLPVAVFTSGCVIGAEKWPRPRDLAPGWRVDRARILAVRADPPELRPGQTATFEALVVDPDAAVPPAVLWLACPPEEEGGIGFGCTLDVGTLDLETATPEELAEVGFIGFDPFIPPVWTVPAAALDAVEPADRLEGIQVLIQVTALPPAILDDEVEDVDFNEVEAAYKRLVVSEAPTPNRNPLVDGFVVDRQPIPRGARVHVDRGQSYELGVVLDERSVETYTYVNSDGASEQREEEPYAHWYATRGTVGEEITLYPYNESTWVAPDRAGQTGTWYVVVRDRRGGIAWWEQDWVVD